MPDTPPTYVPAAGRDWALPLYDRLVRLLGMDAKRSLLVEQAALRPGHRALDIGCGTGTLAIAVKRLYSGVEVAGLDPDRKALARARRKAQEAGVEVRFDAGSCDELPYPDARFDRLFSSFMFHHLRPEQQAATLAEARRVLAPGGSFHLVDFVRPEAPDAGRRARWLTSHRHFRESTESRLAALFRQTGFARVEKVGEETIFFGLLPMVFYRAAQAAPNAGAAL